MSIPLGDTARELHFPHKKTAGAFWRPRLGTAEHGWQMRQTLSVLHFVDEARYTTCDACGGRQLNSAFHSWADGGSRSKPDEQGSLVVVSPTCNTCRGLVRDTTWQDQAACAGKDPDLWYADDNTTDQAKAVTYCRNCPVAAQCLADAFQTEGRGLQSSRAQRRVFGVRGGLRAVDRVAYHESYSSRGGDVEAARSVIDEVLYGDVNKAA